MHKKQLKQGASECSASVCVDVTEKKREMNGHIPREES